MENPIPMVLFCPSCGLQHVDKVEPHIAGCQVLVQRTSGALCTCGVWRNPPHRTHKCARCNHLWRPAEVYTVGVVDIPLGNSDTRPAIRERTVYADLRRTFDLQWEADQRAIKRWQEAHPGNDLVWPDRANMVVWLMEQCEEIRAALKPFATASDDLEEETMDISEIWELPAAMAITAGDLRRAKKVFTTEKVGKK